MKRKSLKLRSESIFDWTMAGVPTLAYLVITLIPCVAGLFFSFTNFGGYSLEFDWIGFANYKKMFADTAFWKSIFNYLKLYFGVVLICFPLAMATAIVLVKNKRIKERNLYRVLFFFPSTVPMLIIAIMWMTMYNPSFGVLNQVLGLFGVEPIQWLGSSKVVMWAMIIMVVWRQFGFYLVYFIAGMSNINPDIYESAKIDGASEWKQVFTITLPLTWNVVQTSMLFFIQTASDIGFGIIYITTQGGPDNASQILPTYMYQKITQGLDYGMSSAVGVAMLVVTFVMAILILKLLKRESYEM